MFPAGLRPFPPAPRPQPDPASHPGPRRLPAAVAGAAMVEFLLVAGILALGLLGLAALQVGAARAQAGARDRAVALNLAVSALERASARARGPGAARDGGTGDGWTRLHDRDGQAEAAGPPFFTVTVTSGAGPDGTQRLRAAVAWHEGRDRVLRLERLTCR